MDIIELCERFFHVNGNDKINVGTIFEFAISCYNESELYIAHELFLCYILTFPNNSEYHNRLGHTWKRWGVYDKSEAEYRIALQLKPKSHIFRWNLGLVYMRENRHHLALKLYVEASELDPNEPEYFVKSGDCYDELNDVINAEKYYLKAIEIGKDRAICHLQYAKFLCKQTRKRLVIDILKQQKN